MQSSPALTPPPGNPRFPLLDSVRGLAAVVIVFGHCYGWLGQKSVFAHGFWDALANTVTIVLPIFFALSGLLLYRPFLASGARGRPAPRARTFFKRRFLRVIPAYWVALTLTALLVPAAAVGAFSDKWWIFYGFGQAYSIEDIHHGLAVAWTLSVDWCFYLLLPLLAWMIRRVGPWAVIVPMLVLGPVVHLFNALPLEPGLDIFFAKITYGLPGQASFFAVGMALAVWSVQGAPRWLQGFTGRPGRTYLIAGGVYLFVAAFLSFANPIGDFSFTVRFVGQHLVALIFALLVLAPATFDERPGPVRAVLSRGRLMWLGIVAYGLYLWHIPVLTFLIDTGVGETLSGWDFVPRIAATFAIVLPVGLALAALSYYIVELPFLRRKDPLASRSESWFTSSGDAVPANGANPGARSGHPRPDPAGGP